MGIRKISIAGLALAVAVTFSSLPELQATPFTGTGSQPTTDNLLQSAQAKKKGAKSGASAKAARRKQVPRLAAAARTSIARAGSAWTHVTRSRQ
jgi:hypothetical protein